MAGDLRSAWEVRNWQTLPVDHKACEVKKMAPAVLTKEPNTRESRAEGDKILWVRQILWGHVMVF